MRLIDRSIVHSFAGHVDLLRVALRNAECVLICTSVTDRSSLESITATWYAVVLVNGLHTRATSFLISHSS